MNKGSRIVTLDSNVLIAALREDEPYSEKCSEMLGETARRLHPLGAEHSLSRGLRYLSEKSWNKRSRRSEKISRQDDPSEAPNGLQQGLLRLHVSSPANMIYTP